MAAVTPIAAMVRAAIASAPRGRRRRKIVIPRALPPRNAERVYLQEILGAMSPARFLIDDQLVPRLSAIAQAAGVRADGGVREIRHDAWDDEVERIMSGVRLEYARLVPQERLRQASRKAAEETERHSRAQLNTQLRALTSIDVVGTSPAALETARGFIAENVSLIKTIPEEYFNKVEQMVLRQFRAGERAESVAAEIAKRFDVSESRAAMIARDQVGKLNGQLTEIRQTELGIDAYFWSTSRDERVRGNPDGLYPNADPSHFDREGERYTWAKPPEGGHPGEPINCFPGDSPVSLHARADKAYRRTYRGELTEIVSAAGVAMRCTPNHPVLTLRGWIAAHRLEVGDHLIEAPAKRFDFFVHDPKRGDVTAEQVFRALSSRGIVHRVTGAASWFHGDTTSEQVDVVEIDRRLFVDIDTESAERRSNDGLTGAAAAASGQRDFATDGIRALHSSNGSMRSVGEPGAVIGAHAGHSLEHGGGAVADPETVLSQHAADRRAGNIEAMSDGLLADAVRVAPQDFGLVEVKAVVRAPFDGFVYNFTTATGWYSAHGLIVHNCRCTATPDLQKLLADL